MQLCAVTGGFMSAGTGEGVKLGCFEPEPPTLQL